MDWLLGCWASGVGVCESGEGNEEEKFPGEGGENWSWPRGEDGRDVEGCLRCLGLTKGSAPDRKGVSCVCVCVCLCLFVCACV
jgi:hypothetical protein